MGDKDFFVYC